MLIPKPYNIYPQTPEYREAFESGYNTTRNELFEQLNKMELVKTTTFSVCLDCPKLIKNIGDNNDI